MKKLKDYFPEFVLNFLAIFLGVLATLYLTGKITENDERKNLRLQLDAVKIELNENIKSIDGALNYMEREDSLRRYVMSVNNPKQLHADSLNKYYHIIPKIRTFTYKKDAYEMLKFTGSMRLIDDKQKLLDIMTCYSDLDNMKNLYDTFLNQKISLFNLTSNINDDFIDLRKPVCIGFYNYYRNNPGIIPAFEEGRKDIEKTLEKL